MESNHLYCICRQPNDEGFMICCDKCDEWFHGDCVGITEEWAKLIKYYFCDSCLAPNSSPEIDSMTSRKMRHTSSEVSADFMVTDENKSPERTSLSNAQSFTNQSPSSTITSSPLTRKSCIKARSVLKTPSVENQSRHSTHDHSTLYGKTMHTTQSMSAPKIKKKDIFTIKKNFIKQSPRRLTDGNQLLFRKDKRPENVTRRKKQKFVEIRVVNKGFETITPCHNESWPDAVKSVKKYQYTGREATQLSLKEVGSSGMLLENLSKENESTESQGTDCNLSKPKATKNDAESRIIGDEDKIRTAGYNNKISTIKRSLVKGREYDPEQEKTKGGILQLSRGRRRPFDTNALSVVNTVSESKVSSNICLSNFKAQGVAQSELSDQTFVKSLACETIDVDCSNISVATTPGTSLKQNKINVKNVQLINEADTTEQRIKHANFRASLPNMDTSKDRSSGVEINAVLSNSYTAAGVETAILTEDTKAEEDNFTPENFVEFLDDQSGVFQVRSPYWSPRKCMRIKGAFDTSVNNENTGVGCNETQGLRYIKTFKITSKIISEKEKEVIDLSKDDFLLKDEPSSVVCRTQKQVIPTPARNTVDQDETSEAPRWFETLDNPQSSISLKKTPEKQKKLITGKLQDDCTQLDMTYETQTSTSIMQQANIELESKDETLREINSEPCNGGVVLQRDDDGTVFDLVDNQDWADANYTAHANHKQDSGRHRKVSTGSSDQTSVSSVLDMHKHQFVDKDTSLCINVSCDMDNGLNLQKRRIKDIPRKSKRIRARVRSGESYNTGTKVDVFVIKTKRLPKVKGVSSNVVEMAEAEMAKPCGSQRSTNKTLYQPSTCDTYNTSTTNILDTTLHQCAVEETSLPPNTPSDINYDLDSPRKREEFLRVIGLVRKTRKPVKRKGNKAIAFSVAENCVDESIVSVCYDKQNFSYRLSSSDCDASNDLIVVENELGTDQNNLKKNDVVTMNSAEVMYIKGKSNHYGLQSTQNVSLPQCDSESETLGKRLHGQSRKFVSIVEDFSSGQVIAESAEQFAISKVKQSQHSRKLYKESLKPEEHKGRETGGGVVNQVSIPNLNASLSIPANLKKVMDGPVNLTNVLNNSRVIKDFTNDPTNTTVAMDSSTDIREVLQSPTNTTEIINDKDIAYNPTNTTDAMNISTDITEVANVSTNTTELISYSDVSNNPTNATHVADNSTDITELINDPTNTTDVMNISTDITEVTNDSTNNRYVTNIPTNTTHVTDNSTDIAEVLSDYAKTFEVINGADVTDGPTNNTHMKNNSTDVTSDRNVYNGSTNIINATTQKNLAVKSPHRREGIVTAGGSTSNTNTLEVINDTDVIDCSTNNTHVKNNSIAYDKNVTNDSTNITSATTENKLAAESPHRREGIVTAGGSTSNTPVTQDSNAVSECSQQSISDTVKNLALMVDRIKSVMSMVTSNMRPQFFLCPDSAIVCSCGNRLQINQSSLKEVQPHGLASHTVKSSSSDAGESINKLLTMNKVDLPSNQAAVNLVEKGQNPFYSDDSLPATKAVDMNDSSAVNMANLSSNETTFGVIEDGQRTSTNEISLHSYDSSSLKKTVDKNNYPRVVLSTASNASSDESISCFIKAIDNLSNSGSNNLHSSSEVILSTSNNSYVQKTDPGAIGAVGNTSDSCSEDSSACKRNVHSSSHVVLENVEINALNKSTTDSAQVVITQSLVSNTSSSCSDYRQSRSSELLSEFSEGENSLVGESVKSREESIFAESEDDYAHSEDDELNMVSHSGNRKGNMLNLLTKRNKLAENDDQNKMSQEDEAEEENVTAQCSHLEIPLAVEDSSSQTHLSHTTSNNNECDTPVLSKKKCVFTTSSFRGNLRKCTMIKFITTPLQKIVKSKTADEWQLPECN